MLFSKDGDNNDLDKTKYTCHMRYFVLVCFIYFHMVGNRLNNHIYILILYNYSTYPHGLMEAMTQLNERLETAKVMDIYSYWSVQDLVL